MISFDDYVKQQLNKQKPEWFDPEGNSVRATVARGRFGGLIYETKNILPSLKKDLIYFWDGFDTPVSYFFQLAILPFILPLLPLLRSWYQYRRSINEYRKEYERMLSNEASKK